MVEEQTSERSYLTAALLSLFFGGLGVDRFYVGHVWLGLLKLLTGGGGGIWYVIDLVLFATGSVRDSQGRELAGARDKKRVVWIIIAVVLILGAIGAFAGLVLFRANDSSETSATSKTVQTEVPAQPVRATRTVAGWTYTVDAAKEQTLSMKVAVSADSSAVLDISGMGCNSISSTVTEQPSEGARSRTVGGKTYYLYPGVSTMMACNGEKANMDAQVHQEIEDIFDSLSR